MRKKSLTNLTIIFICILICAASFLGVSPSNLTPIQSAEPPYTTVENPRAVITYCQSPYDNIVYSQLEAACLPAEQGLSYISLKTTHSHGANEFTVAHDIRAFSKATHDNIDFVYFLSQQNLTNRLNC